MPIKRFKTIEEQPDVTLYPRHDPQNLRRALVLSECAVRLRRKTLKPGLTKRKI